MILALYVRLPNGLLTSKKRDIATYCPVTLAFVFISASRFYEKYKNIYIFFSIEGFLYAKRGRIESGNLTNDFQINSECRSMVYCRQRSA